MLHASAQAFPETWKRPIKPCGETGARHREDRVPSVYSTAIPVISAAQDHHASSSSGKSIAPTKGSMYFS